MRELAAPRVRVIRDSCIQRIAACELVPAIPCCWPKRIAGDAVLREAVDLSVDESLLTGERL